jgi:quinoprotein glucose dehydrogenase
VFLQRADLGCLRCHRYDKEGGEVGPDLSLVGGRLTRSEILESIVLPNARIAAGFAGITIETKDGKTVAGTLRRDSNEGVEVASQEDGLVKIPASQIAKKTEGMSAMPVDLVQQLSRTDLRDLIEFLASSR